MTDIRQILIYLAAFLIVAVAANQISRLFLRIRLPLVTGLLVIGIIAGPDILGLITADAVRSLGFINDLALAYIALAVGSELYLNEMRSRLKSIVYMTVSQMIIIFILTSLGVFILTDLIPFLDVLRTNDRIAVSILVGTIFVARSPASAIAVINELRARGPFTQTVLGVSVMKEFLVIILFSLTFATSVTLVKGISFNIGFAGGLAIELVLVFLMGYLFGKLLGLVVSIKTLSWIKTSFILILGLGIFRFSHYLREITGEYFFIEIYVEPLLVCILGSFFVTNYSSHRPEFLKMMKEAGPPVYAVFFTIVGSTISLDVVSRTWVVALILTGIRLISLVIAGFTGGILAGDPMKFNKAAWAAYISPAGVSIGLAAIVANEFQDWGTELASIILAVIILNQLIGPPLFKWALFYVGESHVRPDSAFTEIKGLAVIFGIENQSIALARQLKNHGWKVRMVSVDDSPAKFDSSDLDMTKMDAINPAALKQVGADKAETIVAMLSDDENFRICEIAYENFGTRELVVRLNQGINFGKFNRLGVKIVEPSTAIVSLLDNFIRTPQATSLLLGLQEGQDTMEIELCNPDLRGLALRDLRLPHDIIILSITRGDQMIISHGYTRLRTGDILTMVGSKKSLQNVKRKFEK